MIIGMRISTDRINCITIEVFCNTLTTGKGPFQKHVLLISAILDPSLSLRASASPPPAANVFSFIPTVRSCFWAPVVPLRASRLDPLPPPPEARAFGTVPNFAYGHGDPEQFSSRACTGTPRSASADLFSIFYSRVFSRKYSFFGGGGGSENSRFLKLHSKNTKNFP